MSGRPERKEYSCTVCWRALTPSQTWVIVRQHDNRQYRCEEHKGNGYPVIGWIGVR